MTSLHAYLGCRDADKAIAWLGEVFGFETTMRFADELGGVAHAELRRGGAALMVFSDRDGYERAPRRGDTSGLGLYLAVDGQAEVDALYARAVGAGGEPVWEPELKEWGNYVCRVVDPEGFEWSVGTHRPGLPQRW